MTSNNQHSEKKIKWALYVIASKSNAVLTLCNQAINTTDNEREEQADLIVAMQCIVEQIGWIADIHGQVGEKGDAADWMLPPAYHQAESDPA